MNTHTSFHNRLRFTEDPTVAYDIALRITSGYEPAIPYPGIPESKPHDKRLNATLYARVAAAAYGAPLGSSSLDGLLLDSVGECVADPLACVTATCNGQCVTGNVCVTGTTGTCDGNVRRQCVTGNA